jgi:redox-sensitive bicupin YhaK (pirin superfamily)
MEIVTYVIEGALEHKDSTGGGSVIRPGDVQRMSAGTGIRHSEYNASTAEPVHFLQIWIIPEQEGLAPGYEQKHLPADTRPGALRLIGSRDGRDGSVTIHRDVDLYAAVVAGGEAVRHDVRPHRKLWLQVVRGSVAVNGADANAGDGIAVEDADRLDIAAKTEAEVLLFDMG